jgi:hypothetical protein
MMDYEGVIYHNPPVAVTHHSEAQPGSAQWYELSRNELDVLLPRCAGAPLRTEHGSGQIGEIVRGFYTPEGHAAVQFRLFDNDVGRNARQLIQQGLMRGLSLSHMRKNLQVVEVSLCFKGARPNTRVTHEVVHASDSKTIPSPYMSNVSSDIITSYSECVATPHLSMAQPNPAQQQQQPLQLQHQQQYNPAVGMSAEEQQRMLLLRQQQQQAMMQQQQQQPTSFATQQLPPGGGPQAIPMQQALAFTDNVLRNAQGTPFQPPMTGALGDAAQLPTGFQAQPVTPGTAQQQQQQPAAPVAPQSATPATETENAAAHGKRKFDDKAAVPTDAQGGAKKERVAGGDDDIVTSVVNHHGPISEKMRIALLEQATARETEKQQLQKRIQELETEKTMLSENTNQLRDQFTDTVLPFMRAVLGDRITARDEEDMRQVVRTKESTPFLTKWGGHISRTIEAVAASALNRRPEQAAAAAAPPAMTDDLRRRVELYHTLKLQSAQLQQSMSSSSSQPTSFAATPLVSAWGAAPMSMPQWTPPVAVEPAPGWRSQAAPPQQVQASSAMAYQPAPAFPMLMMDQHVGDEYSLATHKINPRELM